MCLVGIRPLILLQKTTPGPHGSGYDIISLTITYGYPGFVNRVERRRGVVYGTQAYLHQCPKEQNREQALELTN